MSRLGLEKLCAQISCLALAFVSLALLTWYGQSGVASSDCRHLPGLQVRVGGEKALVVGWAAESLFPLGLFLVNGWL